VTKRTNKDIISFLTKLTDHITNWCFYLAAVLILVLPLIMSYEVAMRYFLNRPTTFAVDFSEYILLFVTFLSAGWISKQEEQIELTLVIDRMNRSTFLIMKIIQSLLGTFMCCFLVWSGFDYLWDAITRNVMIVRPLTIPLFVIVWVIPFAGLILLIHFIRQCFSFLASLKGGSVAPSQKAGGGKESHLQ
jgi:C4-dicarboxylate transporter, DctQ subunit